MEVDLSAVTTSHRYEPELDRLGGIVRDGLVEIPGNTIRMTLLGRPLVRMAAAFDRYLDRTGDAAPRHARAV